MPKRLISLIKFLIGWPLSLISLFFIFKLIYSNAQSLFQLTNLNLTFLFISILCFLTYFFLRVLLWHEIIRQKGNKFSFKKTAYFWEISEIKRYTPGNIWSFLSRSNLFAKDNLSTKDVASSLIIEIILIVLSSFFLSYFYLSYYVKNIALDNLLIGLIILGVTIFVLGNKIKFLKKIISPQNRSLDNFKMFLIALLAFFMFGLATYFSAISIFYLTPNHLIQFISLFVFSLLVGYLSIITPMGLGVREGVTTYGLSAFIPIASAGLISIFSRIIFVISEVIFISLVFIWEKSYKK